MYEPKREPRHMYEPQNQMEQESKQGGLYRQWLCTQSGHTTMNLSQAESQKSVKQGVETLTMRG